MLYLILRFHRGEHMRELLHIPSVGKGRVALRTGRQQLDAAELCLFVIFLKLGDHDIHLPKKRTDGVLYVPFFKRHPAVLNRHFFLPIIREGKIRIFVDHLPQELYLRAGVLFYDRRTVVADNKGRILRRQLLMSGPAAACRLNAEPPADKVSCRFTVLYKLRSRFTARKIIICHFLNPPFSVRKAGRFHSCLQLYKAR